MSWIEYCSLSKPVAIHLFLLIHIIMHDARSQHRLCLLKVVPLPRIEPLLCACNMSSLRLTLANLMIGVPEILIIVFTVSDGQGHVRFYPWEVEVQLLVALSASTANH